MSTLATAWAIRQKTGSPISKLILLKLADQANDEGVCWPSQRTLATHCEVARETANRHLQRLARAGLLRIEPQSVDGFTMPCRYRLALEPASPRAGVTHNHPPGDGGSHPSDAASQPGVSKAHTRGNPESQGGVTHDHTKGFSNNKPSGYKPSGVTHTEPRASARAREGDAPGATPVQPPDSNNDCRTPSHGLDSTYGDDEDTSEMCSPFERWWAEYPRKRKKKQARDKWADKQLDRLAHRLIADVRTRRVHDAQWLRGYIPDPLTYLNGERWDDEIEDKDRATPERLQPGARHPGGVGGRQRELAEQYLRERGLL